MIMLSGLILLYRCTFNISSSVCAAAKSHCQLKRFLALAPGVMSGMMRHCFILQRSTILRCIVSLDNTNRRHDHLRMEVVMFSMNVGLLVCNRNLNRTKSSLCVYPRLWPPMALFEYFHSLSRKSIPLILIPTEHRFNLVTHQSRGKDHTCRFLTLCRGSCRQHPRT